MSTPTCPRCGTVLLPGNRVCPFCRMPIAEARSPSIAPSPDLAPSPPRVCSSCRTELALPQQMVFPQVAEEPVTFLAYVCPKCGRVAFYRPHDAPW